jgi:hypothetical protein
VRTLLVSYADGPSVHRRNQRALIRSATGRGVDSVLAGGRTDLSVDFRQRHRQILDHSRGAGYWLWKPYVILEGLQWAADGDTVVYMDAGITVRRSLEPLLELARRSDLVLVQNRHPNASYVKRDCFVLTGTDTPACHGAPQLDASLLLLRNTAANRAFVEAWLMYCTDARVLTDQPNECGLPDLPGFAEHRHDQAVLSVLWWRERSRLPHVLCDPETKATYLRHHHRRNRFVPIGVWDVTPMRLRAPLALGWQEAMRRGWHRLRRAADRRPISSGSSGFDRA